MTNPLSMPNLSKIHEKIEELNLLNQFAMAALTGFCSHSDLLFESYAGALTSDNVQYNSNRMGSIVKSAWAVADLMMVEFKARRSADKEE